MQETCIWGVVLTSYSVRTMTPVLAPPFTCADLRSALRACAAGVTVLTTTGDEPFGVAAGPFTSVSMAPPVVLGSVCASAARAVERSGVFAVNVLAGGKERLLARFSGPAGTAFEDVAWLPGRTAAPLLLDATCTLDCELTLTFGAGTETLLVGEVRGVGRAGL
jgi:flavin reductase (DIM6/NTAB) family NADH-FMN oxidoreductase RutF